MRICTFLFLFAGITPGCLAQVFVDGSGSCGGNSPCYTTVQAGVNAASPGQIVSVYPGVYNEKITIPQSLTLESVSGPGVTTLSFAGTGNYEAPLMIPGGVSDVTIGGAAGKGFTIIGMDNTNDAAGAGQEAAAILIGAGTSAMSRIQISYNTIRANGEAGILTYYSATPYLSGLSITHNTIEGTTYTGTPASGSVFSNYNTPKSAVAVNKGAQNLVFSENTVTARTGAGGIGNVLISVESVGGTVDQNQIMGYYDGSLRAALRIRGSSFSITCNVISRAGAGSSAVYYLTTDSSPVPYTTATVAAGNTFISPGGQIFGNSIGTFGFGTAANSVNPAPGCSPLPVTLAAFTAIAEGRDARLNWSTASERNNSHFMVEHSVRLPVFETIATLSGHGTTSDMQRYTYRHVQPDPTQTHYYRLRQVDNDGTAHSGPVRSVVFPTGPLLRVLSQPATGGAIQAAISSSENDQTVELTVTDFQGRVIRTQTCRLIRGDNPVRLTGLAAGVYLLSMKDPVHTQTIRVYIRE